MTFAAHPLLRLPLRALTPFYAATLRARNRYYDRPGATFRAPLPVISIGNLTLGGTGKTPLVAWLARSVADNGVRPAIVSRGYGGSAGRGPLVVSRGAGPLCDALVCGDEPYWLAATLQDVPVIVGSDRSAGAVTAAGLGCEAVILDDGFQHRRLARDLDIVLLDAGNPFGNGRLLPAGTLREPLAALSRADLVLLTRSGPGDAHPEIEARIRAHNADAPILRAGHRRAGFFDGEGRPVAAPGRAVVFCAIGSPEGFRRDIEAEDVEIVVFDARRDHHRYDPAELDRLRSRAAMLDATLITTEKDRVRLPPGFGAEPSLLTLRIVAEPHDPAALLDALRRTLDRQGRWGNMPANGKR